VIVLKVANPLGASPPDIALRNPPVVPDRSIAPETDIAPTPEWRIKEKLGPVTPPLIVTSPPVRVSTLIGLVNKISPVKEIVPPVDVTEPPSEMGALIGASVVAVTVMIPGPVEVTDDPVLNPLLLGPFPPTIKFVAVKSLPVENIPCKLTP
jgi:hypothetical protein